MSIQPLWNSSPATDTAGSRRPAVERDDGAQRESFVLPREEPAREAAAPARDARNATRGDAGNARTEAANQRSEQRQEAADARRGAGETAAAEQTDKTAGTQTETTAADTGATPVAVAPGKTASTTPEPAATASPTASSLDIAALISIAVATETDGQPATPGQVSVSGGEMPVAEKAEDDAGTGAGASSEPLAAEVAPVVMLDPSAPPQTPPTPALSLPIDLAVATPGSTTVGENDTPAGETRSAPIAALAGAMARQTMLAGETAADSATPSVPGAAAGAAPIQTPASQAQLSLLDITPAAIPATGEGSRTGKTDAMPAATDGAAPLQGAIPVAPATPSDAKPLETFEQALNAIDLSAGNLQGTARPDPLRLVNTPDPIVAQAAASQSAATAESQPTPLHVLPIEIGMRALAGARQFEIRLDPGELGRVDVTLSISDTGEVSAKMVVDRVETLHLLQRDARTLERAFEQAGLKPSDAGVDITLRDPSDQSGFRQNRQQDEASQQRRGLVGGSEAGEDNPIPASSAPLRRFVRLGGVDMSV